MPSPLQILQQYWNHDRFRPMQEDIIQSVLKGNDTLALLPTGGGKSICFQVPGLLLDGVTLVISPLIALMQDQVANLQKKNIPATALHSGLSMQEVKRILQQATRGDFRFLYLSPERLETTVFKEYLPAIPIRLLVVDEAHCVSQWGYDFRPPYLRIAALRDELKKIPVLALTASATPVVQNDILDKLSMQQASVFRQSFLRPNLSYSVFQVDSKPNKMLEILEKVDGSSIVYAGTRRQTKELATMLQQNGISADFYHAGLPAEERSRKQEDWIRSGIRVMVCTNAFGMGIDKPDVRTVIHYNTPECLENYYQEAGRAGRDGKKSYAVLLWQKEDQKKLKQLPDKRFPPIPEIKKVYQALADYLQLPVGTGEGQSFDVDIAALSKNFQLEQSLVMSALSVLEQEGHLRFSNALFQPSQVIFTTDKKALTDFNAAYPELEPLVQCLLRTYAGIFDNSVSIHEKQLGFLLHTSEAVVRKQLQQLQAMGIISYQGRKEDPQIQFLLNRAPAQYLQIDQDQYLRRKKMYTDRIHTMLGYLRTDLHCRSEFIAAYFGDADTKECSICDACLTRKRKPVDQLMLDTILSFLQQNRDITVDQLRKQLPRISKEKIWEILNLLQDEEKIQISEKGEISLYQ
jgi:ATP-dependent DNA helicase RecQ